MGLKRQIQKIRAGDHVCLLYKDLAEQMEAVVPYLQEGLTHGEACVYVVDDRISDQILRALTRAGVDVELQIERGSLAVKNKFQAYAQEGKFDPHEAMEKLLKTYQEKVKAGFGGLRIAVEMTWALETEDAFDQLMEYEEMLNKFFSDKRTISLCQYNVNRFPVSVIERVSRIHPTVILNGHISDRLSFNSRMLDQTTS